MQLTNLDYFRNLKLPDSPEFGARLYQVFRDIVTKSTNTEQQANLNPEGPPSPPAPPDAVDVSGQDGYLHVAITHNAEIYRGIQYHLEHADNPHFTNPIPVSMVNSRHLTIPVGNQTRYVRIAASYPSSPPSNWVYHGGSQPIGVNGGGSGPGPLFLPSQGSGTGHAGVGLQGPGKSAFRSATGVPPVR